MTIFVYAVSIFSLVTGHSSLVTVWAEQLPSLFRGVMVADSPVGVRVVSVEENSQAALADLRPEDLIIQINGTPLKTIDDFAVVSQALKRSATKVGVVILRNGQPRELLVHLYSYPVLRRWDLTFVPDHDIRFAEAKAGVAYWMRLARGFETAGRLDQALNATLNALHNDPGNVDVALKASELLGRIAHAKLTARQLGEALIAIREGTILLGKLFEQPLDAAKLQAIKSQLEETLRTLRATTP
jgi:membrane-associated protease RseP (regulator of RpoE activity)